MFPSGPGWPQASAMQSQPAQTPTGQWQPLVPTSVGLLDPLASSNGAAVTVAPFAGSGSGAVASWMVPTAPAAPPAVDPWANVAVPSLEDKAAIAREKNRIAQRRFREKERRRLVEVQQAADNLAADIAAVNAEKDQLELEHTLMQKTLAVRNAMLALVKTLEPSDDPQHAQAAGAAAAAAAGAAGAGAANSTGPAAASLDDAAVQRASEQLAAAMGELPSPEQLAHIVTSPLASSSSGSVAEASASGSARAEPAVASAGATSAAAEAPGADGAPAPLNRVIAAAAGLDMEAGPQGLVELVSPKGDTDLVRQRVQDQLGTPQQLQEFWLGWRGRICQSFAAAEASGFSDGEATARVEQEMEDMTQIFYTVGECKPRVFNTFLLANLAPPGPESEAKWLQMAQRILPMLSEAEVVNLLLAYQRLLKRSAIAAVSVKPWVQRLQSLAAASAGGAGTLQQLSRWHTQIGEITARMNKACHDQYLASVLFLAELSRGTGPIPRTYFHVAAAPHIPDHALVVGEVLRLHRERQAQQQAQQRLQQPPAQ
ncbi:hypothetical protein ABPG75_001357 [Micractinium tetrahymenae]